MAERVRRLEDAGIIRGYRADLNLEKAGCPIMAIIRVGSPESQFARLKALAVALREVLECHHVTGADSLVLKVAATSVGHLEKVIEQLGRYGTPTTTIVLSSPVTTRVFDGWAPASAGRERKASASRRTDPPPR